MTAAIPYIVTFLLAILTDRLVNNVVLSRFYGICAFMGVSNKVKNSFSMGLAVVFVIRLAALICWPLYYYVLVPLKIVFRDTLTYILVIASLVQIVGRFIKKFSPTLYKAFGIYLPLITTNCAVLGVVQENTDVGIQVGQTMAQNFGRSRANALGTSLGYLIRIVIFACVRQRRKENTSTTPKAFRGTAEALVVAGIRAIAIRGLRGIGA